MYDLLQKCLPLTSYNFLQIKQKKINSKLRSSLLNSENWIDEFEKKNFKNYSIFQNQSNNQNLLKDYNTQLQKQNQKRLKNFNFIFIFNLFYKTNFFIF